MELKSTRDAYGDALLELVEDTNVVVLDADLSVSTQTNKFAKRCPERFFNVGCAEQNLIGVAAGLAICGKIPFVISFAVFVTKRAADQVSISIAYPKLNVKIIGAYTGLFNGRTGATHMAIEDMSIMRTIPNIVVIDPADIFEIKQAMMIKRFSLILRAIPSIQELWSMPTVRRLTPKRSLLR